MMAEPLDLHDLIRRARSGDEAASAELVQRLEPFIQRVVRLRMRQRGDYDVLRRAVGASDVCQSVFRSLFRGLRDHRYQLDQPGDLERLLHRMIRFNVATKARRASVRLRELIPDFEQDEWAGSYPPPDGEVAHRELIERIQEQFSEDELELLTLWLDGVPWHDIGRRNGCTPDAARVRLQRAIVRVRGKMVREDPADA
jgi:DNA-directed RNA polymerase specialized sigma24 family protein